MINLYEVLNVKKKCSRNTIKKEYRKLVIIYHPDKGGDPKLFELINKAYETLIDESKRKEYDKSYSLWTQSNNDHFALKDSSIAFLETQEELVKNMDSKKIEDKKKEFLNKNVKEEVLSKDELLTRMKDLELAREQDDLDNIQKNLFENSEFDDNDFNANFEACVSKKDLNIDLPSQSNNFKFEELNENEYGTISNNSYYSNVSETDFNIKKSNKKKITKKKKEILKMNEKNEENIKELLENKIKERDNETEKLSKIEFDNFIKEIPDKYSILNSFSNKLNLENNTQEYIQDKDLEKQFEKLKNERINDS